MKHLFRVQNFEINQYFLPPDTQTHGILLTRAYQGVRDVNLSETLHTYYMNDLACTLTAISIKSPWIHLQSS